MVAITLQVTDGYRALAAGHLLAGTTEAQMVASVTRFASSIVEHAQQEAANVAAVNTVATSTAEEYATRVPQVAKLGVFIAPATAFLDVPSLENAQRLAQVLVEYVATQHGC